MNEHLKSLAYDEMPLQPDAPHTQAAQYCMMRCVYHRFRTKRIGKEQGAQDIQQIERYGTDRENDEALLNDFIGRLFEDYERGYLSAFPLLKHLSYHLAHLQGACKDIPPLHFPLEMVLPQHPENWKHD